MTRQTLFAGVLAAFVGFAASVAVVLRHPAAVGAFPLSGALMGAVNQPDGREAASITFLVTASGLSFFGISGAFWGLSAGGTMRALAHWLPKST